MDYTSLLKILLEWSMKNKEYHLANFIFSEFNIGLPVRLLYSLPSSNIFYSFDTFKSNNELKNIDDYYLRELFSKCIKSKYKRLDHWNSFGYLNTT